VRGGGSGAFFNISKPKTHSPHHVCNLVITLEEGKRVAIDPSYKENYKEKRTSACNASTQGLTKTLSLINAPKD